MSQNPVVIIDDDPTGSQTVGRADLVFDVDRPLDMNQLSRPGSVTFLLANTRALDATATEARTRRIARQLAAAPSFLTVISRGDSTLRGHTILEVTCLQEEFAAAGRGFDLVLFAPAFFDAGRRTVESVHEVSVRGGWTPVAETEYAADATFGFTQSRLPDYLEEVSHGGVTADGVLHLGRELLDSGDPAAIAKVLLGAKNGSWVTTDGRDAADYRLVASAARRAQEQGRTILFRAGPSMVQALTGQQSQPPAIDENGRLVTGTPRGPHGPHGLVVVGSHTARTSEQFAELVAVGDVRTVELDVDRVGTPGFVDQVAAAVSRSLKEGTTALHTSRSRRSSGDPVADLATAMLINDAVNATVRRVVETAPAYVIAKGGITSNEVARVGCQIHRAELLGQLFPGQVTLACAEEAPDNLLGLPYAIFPGNVGEPSALAHAVAIMDSLVCIGSGPAAAGLWHTEEHPSS
ncbi:four-carbon acid sugar kinase family protein [Arsenicicoccus sp. oral taxon 190]|uniref:four-carbon acid sugar kinase family protein n=1 Tax=Arsenicicoccus sp. oral taxon 190 TaxID=1658671 RepID=UPI00067BCDB5|nr:four-carbon acid sugar kinase family protein [Arsenicicoccus sp. oral taxon 190]